MKIKMMCHFPKILNMDLKISMGGGTIHYGDTKLPFTQEIDQLWKWRKSLLLPIPGAISSAATAATETCGWRLQIRHYVNSILLRRFHFRLFDSSSNFETYIISISVPSRFPMLSIHTLLVSPSPWTNQLRLLLFATSRFSGGRRFRLVQFQRMDSFGRSTNSHVSLSYRL